MEYALLKLVHLGALVFWLGPALGAWMVLTYAQRARTLDSEALAAISRVFFFTLIIEHVAFIALICSGLLMAMTFGYFEAPWLQQKLWIVCGVLVPLELVDIVLGNFMASSASRRLYGGKPVTDGEKRCLDLYHGTFTKIAIVIVPVSVVVIMYLAISKSGLDL